MKLYVGYIALSIHELVANKACIGQVGFVANVSRRAFLCSQILSAPALRELLNKKRLPSDSLFLTTQLPNHPTSSLSLLSTSHAGYI